MARGRLSLVALLLRPQATRLFCRPPKLIAARLNKQPLTTQLKSLHQSRSKRLQKMTCTIRVNDAHKKTGEI